MFGHQLLHVPDPHVWGSAQLGGPGRGRPGLGDVPGEGVGEGIGAGIGVPGEGDPGLSPGYPRDRSRDPPRACPPGEGVRGGHVQNPPGNARLKSGQRGRAIGPFFCPPRAIPGTLPGEGPGHAWGGSRTGLGRVPGMPGEGPRACLGRVPGELRTGPRGAPKRGQLGVGNGVNLG
jgi:hypothetical protein